MGKSNSSTFTRTPRAMSPSLTRKIHPSNGQARSSGIIVVASSGHKRTHESDLSNNKEMTTKVDFMAPDLYDRNETTDSLLVVVDNTGLIS